MLPLLLAASLQAEVQAIAQREARVFLEQKADAKPLESKHPRLKKPGPVFVTVTEGGKTRGCWGSLEPQTSSLAAEIALNTRKALSLDYRFPPVNPGELPALSFYISLVGPLQPVEDIGCLAPLREGLFVTDGSRGGVLLPGEAKTARWQVEECRRKAGLRPGTSVRMFRFETTVFGPLQSRQSRESRESRQKGERR